MLETIELTSITPLNAGHSSTDNMLHPSYEPLRDAENGESKGAVDGDKGWDDETWDGLVGGTNGGRLRTRMQFESWRDVTLTDMRVVRELSAASQHERTGLRALLATLSGAPALVFITADGLCLAPGMIKVEGSVFKPAERVVGRFVS